MTLRQEISFDSDFPRARLKTSNGSSCNQKTRRNSMECLSVWQRAKRYLFREISKTAIKFITVIFLFGGVTLALDSSPVNFKTVIALGSNLLKKFDHASAAIDIGQYAHSTIQKVTKDDQPVVQVVYSDLEHRLTDLHGSIDDGLKAASTKLNELQRNAKKDNEQALVALFLDAESLSQTIKVVNKEAQPHTAKLLKEVRDYAAPKLNEKAINKKLAELGQVTDDIVDQTKTVANKAWSDTQHLISETYTQLTANEW